MEKNLIINALIVLSFITILSSCNTIYHNNGGRTYRYVYKGSTVYECFNNGSRGDSTGIIEETILMPLEDYLHEMFSTVKFWKIESKGKPAYVDMEDTGWDRYIFEEPDSSLGRLIVKTVILEGKNAGREEEKMRILILDSTINQKDVDYAPTISPDGKYIIFVSNRHDSKLDKKMKPSHDFWAVKKENKYSTGFSMPFNIDTTTELGWRGVNTRLNEGVATIAADGRTLFFTGCNRADGIGDCDIYRSKAFENKWSRPVNLGREVNSGSWDSQPSIAPDMKRLYFTSNREGPHGTDNYDIWYCDWDEYLDEWQPALNLTAINTEGKEVAPFIAADGVTLFFSTNGYEPGKKDLDFYVTRYDMETKSWSEPAKLSEPLNTDFDEQFITLPASGDIIYFSSKRKDIPGFQGDLDLYMALVKSFFRAIVIKVYVADDSGDDIATKITVDNTVSKRLVRDYLSEKDNVLSMVLTNADYGEINDTLPYIDLEIRAENWKYGEKKKILRVKNPLLSGGKEGWVFTDEIDVTFEISVSPELDKYLERTGRTVLDASVSASEFDNEDLEQKLVIEEFHSTQMQPLLNYVFFDDNSPDIPNRYVKLTKDEAQGFEISDIPEINSLHTYYNILNIIGKRLNDNADASVTLIGCNSNNGYEKDDLDLSLARAKRISDYLADVWNIKQDRIIIDARNLPANPSNGNIIEGIEENRRVEIYSDDMAILTPVVSYEKLFIANPPIINFDGMVSVKGGEAEWKFTAKQDDVPLKIFSGEGSLDRILIWNINEEKSTIPKSESPLIFELEVKDKKKDKVIVAKGKFQVEQITSSQKLEEKNADKRIDRFSLILFEFGKSDLNDNNIAIIESIKDHIKPNSIIKAIGYSDRLGNEKYNQKLSRIRADKTATALGGNYTVVQGMGESKLLYDNDFPEGRFYCRTVEIIVETPIEKVETAINN